MALNRTGKIQSELWVLADDSALYVSVSRGLHQQLHSEFDRMLIMEDAELSDESGNFRWYALHGAEAPARAAQLAAQFGGVSGAISWTAVGGAALALPRGAPALEQTDVGLSWLDDAAWQAFRISHALPEFGVDYDSQDRPHEAGIERRAISWTKGCYLGQEVVCMQDMRGKVKRSLKTLEVRADASAAVKPGVNVLAATQPIGSLTSVARVKDHWLCMASVTLDKLDAPLALDGIVAAVTVHE